MKITSDFDGTIALCDVTDLVLSRFAPPEWEVIEAAWRRGEIDAATCMSRQISLLACDRAALDDLLDTVAIDPGFLEFVRWTSRRGIPLEIASDGVDYFIQRILARHGLEHIPVFANRLEWRDGKPTLQHPWRKSSCVSGSGVCKCAIAATNDQPLVYIGDGRSDECVAPQADILFAKTGLANFCRANGLHFYSFKNFHEVRHALDCIVIDSESRRTDRIPAGAP